MLNPRSAFSPEEGDVVIQGHRDRHTQRGEGHVTTEAEIGMTQLQVKECQELLATTQKKEEPGTDSPLQPPKSTWPCQHLNFRPAVVVLSHLVCGISLKPLRETSIFHYKVTKSEL